MVRILHTSDWHLGASLEGFSRDEEHGRFLDWLVGTLRDGGDEVLVVAGDVFDQAQPSAEAQRAYFRFLTRLGDTAVRQVVIVGGNHDSATRLDAPRELLETLRIQVVGGLGGDPASWDRCLCPVRDADGRVVSVVVAVPFVHECRLGVQTALEDEEAIRASFVERFTALYRDLADRAEAAGGGAPLIATGHLACVGALPGDEGARIHRIGSVTGLPPDIFDPRYRHVALGHLHRMFRVRGSRAWYSGTPVPVNLPEAATPRFVLRVGIPDGDGDATVTPIRVPAWRALVEVAGGIDEVTAGIRQLSWDTDLPPYVLARVRVDSFQVGIDGDVLAAAQAHGTEAPRILRVVQERTLAGGGGDGPSAVSLRDLTPEEVFRQLCQVRGVGDDPDLVRAFQSLLAQEVEG